MQYTCDLLIHVHLQQFQLLHPAGKADVRTSATRTEGVEGSFAGRLFSAGAARKQSRPDVELQAGPFGQSSLGLDGEGELERPGVKAGEASEGELQNVDAGKPLSPGILSNDVDERPGEGDLMHGPVFPEPLVALRESSLFSSLILSS